MLGALWRNQGYPVEYQAMKLALDEVNDSGGVEGRSFAMVGCGNEELPDIDDLDGEAANISMTEYLTGKIGVSASVGPTSSSESEDAYAVGEPNDALFISPSATSPALTAMDGLACSDEEPGLFWRTAPPDDLQGRIIAEFLEESGRDRVAVIYEEGAYGEGLQVAFSESFSGEVQRQPYDSAAAIAAYTVDLAASYPEIIFISSSQDEIIAFLNVMAGVVAEGKSPVEGIFLADGAHYESVLEGVKDPAEVFELVRGTRPTSDTESLAYETFIAAFSAHYGGDDVQQASFAAHAYDATWMLFYGAAWAVYQESEVRGTTIARGLRQLSQGSELDIRYTTWNEIRASLEIGQSVDLLGSSGEIDYDPVSCETSAPIEIWEVVPSGGSYEFSTVDIRE